MEMRPFHTALPVIAQERFEEPIALYQVVTFLNRSLKRDGYVFGLDKTEDGFHITIYHEKGIAQDPQKK